MGVMSPSSATEVGEPHRKKLILVTGPADRIAGVSLAQYALDRYDLELGIRSTLGTCVGGHSTSLS